MTSTVRSQFCQIRYRRNTVTVVCNFILYNQLVLHNLNSNYKLTNPLYCIIFSLPYTFVRQSFSIIDVYTTLLLIQLMPFDPL